MILGWVALAANFQPSKVSIIAITGKIEVERAGINRAARLRVGVGSPGGNASAIGVRSNCQRAGHGLPARWTLTSHQQSIGFANGRDRLESGPRCSSVTGQHGWLGNYDVLRKAQDTFGARPHWASGMIVASGGRMSMTRRENSFIDASRCRPSCSCRQATEGEQRDYDNSKRKAYSVRTSDKRPVTGYHQGRPIVPKSPRMPIRRACR
jgi:hypothetical protein